MLDDIFRLSGPPTRMQSLLLQALNFEWPIIRDTDSNEFGQLLARHCFAERTLPVGGLYWAPRLTKVRTVCRRFGYIREQQMVNPTWHLYRFRCEGMYDQVAIKMTDIEPEAWAAN